MASTRSPDVSWMVQRQVLTTLAGALLRGHAPLTLDEIAVKSSREPREVEAALGLLREVVTPPRRWPVESYAIRRDAGYVIAIEFGHAGIRVALTDLTGHRIAEASPEDVTSVDHEADASMGLAADTTAGLLGNVLRHPIAAGQIVGVGVSIGAAFDSRTDTVAAPDAMPGWRGRLVARDLRARLALDRPVIVGNDAKLGALSEHYWGAAQGAHDALYVKWGQGVGSGLILGDHLQTGSRGVAGEFGHVPCPGAGPPGPVCPRCGKPCLEAAIGLPALLPQWLKAGEHPSPHDVSKILSEIPAARDRVTEAARLLGLALGPVVTMLNPERVVLGGIFDGRDNGFIIEEVITGLAETSMPAVFESIAVMPGEFTGHASLSDAAAIVLKEELVDYLVRASHRSRA